MSVTARTPDQVLMGMMQRSCGSLSQVSFPGESGSGDLGGVLEVVPAAHGAVGVLGQYWARSSWSSCCADSAHVGAAARSQQQKHQLGLLPFSSSSSPPEYPSFAAGKYNPGHGGRGGGMGPFSLGVSSSLSLCEPTRGCGASFATVQQPLLEAVEGITEASTMAGPAAAGTHGHVELTVASPQQQGLNTNNSSCSEHHSGGRSSADAHSPARSPSCEDHKRKKDLASPDPKGVEGEVAKAKRCKGDKARQGSGSSEVSTDSGSPIKAPPGESKGKSLSKEYSKQDYIHVRARRGQATDSHSLAERVRREKINERMKFLQDLVPGCKKVTGKAVMLDEIIKYVQSLQRLVEVQHLTMNLASVSPAQPDVTLERLVSSKEMLQAHSSSILSSNAEEPPPPPPPSPGALDLVQMGLSHQAGRRLVGGGPRGFDFQLPLANAGPDLRHHMSLPVASLAAAESTMVQRSLDNNYVSQAPGWDGELQGVVQMGFSHEGRLGAFEGQLPVAHMKVEF